VADQTQPEDYDPVFDQGVVIVGGQAVNIWAEVYAARGDRILETFAPFMSKDADVGFIELKRDNKRFRVEVLRSVKGLTDEDLLVKDPLEKALIQESNRLPADSRGVGPIF